MGVMEELLEAVEKLNKKIDNMPVQGGDPQPAVEGKEVLNAEELAEFLDVSKDTIYRKAREGRIPYIRVGSNYKFPVQSIRKWLNEEAEDNHTREKDMKTSELDRIELLG